MTNPYLQIAEEVTRNTIPNTIKIRKPLPRKLPQTSPIGPPTQLSQLGLFGELSNFSKFRKMVFLAALGAGFAASKMFFNKYEVAVFAEHPEYAELRKLMPKVDKLLLPITGIMAFPVALALFSDQEWPMLAWICWLGAIAYSLKETGPDVIRIIRETKESADEYKEKAVTAARKKHARRK